MCGQQQWGLRLLALRGWLQRPGRNGAAPACVNPHSASSHQLGATLPLTQLAHLLPPSPRVGHVRALFGLGSAELSLAPNPVSGKGKREGSGSEREGTGATGEARRGEARLVWACRRPSAALAAGGSGTPP